MSARRSDALLSRLEFFGMRLGLDRIRQLLHALGDPHLASPIVLVAGTNGKGSTAALLSSMSRAAGYRTGLYTSPHLHSVTERFAVDGRAISDRRLAGYLELSFEQARARDGELPTYFEALTVAALLYFRDLGVDIAIMEVGLGGRLDATNVCEPQLSLVTSIGLDHEAHLGDTVESIAREKSGILRRGRPAVALAGTPEVARVLEECAQRVGAELELADRLEVSTSTPHAACPQRARLQTPRGAYDLELHLPGRHQLRNLAVAVRAAEILADSAWPALDANAIASGVASCRWPGRLEWIALPNGRRVLLDAAHNAAGMEALLSFLDHTGERPDLLFGALAEKSIDPLVTRLAASVQEIVLTRPSSGRAADPDRWLPLFANRTVRVENDPQRALKRALAISQRTLLVCGSIYLIGEIRSLLLQQQEPPRSAQPSTRANTP